MKSVVASYPSGSIPVKWTAYVHYINMTSSTLTLTCSGGGGTLAELTENLSGGSGDTGGSVSASSSQCSQNPGLVVNVPPGDTDTDWAAFGNVPWPGTSVSLTWAPVGTSPYIHPFGPGDTDWADGSFCTSHYSQPALSYSNWGVTPCGQTFGTNSKTQGAIYYNGVELDSVGFQCVELAARYFYFETTQAPPHPASGALFASSLSGYGYKVYPAGSMNGTNKFQSSLTAGNIISMWSKSDTTGHVAVVTSVNVTGGNGTITLMDENAAAGGTDTMTVSNGTTSYATAAGGYDEFQWTTNLHGSG